MSTTISGQAPPEDLSATVARRDVLYGISRSEMPLILGIETSCDETAAALIEGGSIRANVVSSQAELHARYGGVVPEVASRRHLELVTPVIREALGEAGAALDDGELLRGPTRAGGVGAPALGVPAAGAGRGGPRRPPGP